MARKKAYRVPVRLNKGNIRDLPFEEIKAILRATDDIIFSGGRTLLAKILKGSKEKKLLGRNLDKNPFYGYFHELATEDITAKIDWLILNRCLKIGQK